MHMPNRIVLLDTNFLLVPWQFGVDIFSELERICDFPFEPAVLAETVGELERLVSDKATSASDRKAARLGLQLIKAKCVRVIGPDRKVFKSADKAILEFASATAKKTGQQVAVATQDKELKMKLKAKGVTVAVLRQKRYVMLD